MSPEQFGANVFFHFCRQCLQHAPGDWDCSVELGDALLKATPRASLNATAAPGAAAAPPTLTPAQSQPDAPLVLQAGAAAQALPLLEVAATARTDVPVLNNYAIALMQASELPQRQLQCQ